MKGLKKFNKSNKNIIIILITILNYLLIDNCFIQIKMTLFNLKNNKFYVFDIFLELFVNIKYGKIV